MDILIYIGLAVAGFIAGLLVGRKNPSIATSAAVLVAKGDSVLQTEVAQAKAKLGVK